MNERDFELRLRDFYRAEADTANAAQVELLRQGVWAVPDEVPVARGLFATRRGIVLMAAALLTALLVGGAVAVGAGILRLPWLPDNVPDERNEFIRGVSPELLQPSPCDQSLPESVLLSVVIQDASGPPMQTLVYESGTVVRKPQFDLPDEPAPWEQRRIAPDAIQRLLSAVEASGLRDCMDVPVTGDAVTAQARLGSGVVAFSLRSGWMRVSTAAELGAGTDLADRLRDPELGLGPGAWLDDEWQPLPKERWEIRIPRWEGSQEAFGEVPFLEWRDLVLPDGANPLTYGRPLQVDPEFIIFVDERCQVVAEHEADEMQSYLEDVTPDPGIWSFRDETGGIQFQVSPLAPHESGCTPRVPSEVPSARDNLIRDQHVCEYLPASLTADVLPEPWSTLGEPDDEFGDGGWAACEYWQGWLFASRHRVNSHEAEPIVQVQFGADYTTEVIAGRTVYFNDCPDGAEGCEPAIAISAEPHLVIVAPTDTDASEEMLKLLAEIVIEQLDV